MIDLDDMGAREQAAAEGIRRVYGLPPRFTTIIDNPAKNERIRRSLLRNRLAGVADGYAHTVMDTGVVTREELDRLQAWVTASLTQMDEDDRSRRFPAEPEVGDNPCVVMFTRTIMARQYVYAALRIGSGHRAGTWVVTGPQSPGYVSWDELVAWVEKATPSDQDVIMNVATSWETA